MEDSFIAVRHFSQDVKELKQAELKDWRADFDKVVSTNLNIHVDFPTQQYQNKSFVYHAGRNQYLQVKKFDEQRKLYLCRPKEDGTLMPQKSEDIPDVEV